MFNSIALFFGISSTSLLSTIFISKVFNIKLINPKFDLQKIKQNSSIMLYTLNMLFLTFLPVFKLFFINKITTENHEYIYSIYLITKYATFVELFYYIFHFSLHKNKWLYQNIHKKHHENVDVYPFDAFYIDYYDLLGVNSCLLLPSYLVSINYYEFILIAYFYTLSGVLVHSDYFTLHHKNHHKYLNCNYSFIFPIYDIIFETSKK